MLNIIGRIRGFLAPDGGDESSGGQSGELNAPREKMIGQHLQSRGIRSPAVLQAMQKVPRERFVAAADAPLAYDDRALPIACGQTISQPYMVALMTEALQLTGGEHVLEIGTGSGYQTALLAELAGDVVSIERHAELSKSAGEILSSLGYSNVKLVVADGSQGWPAEAPYDRILVAAATDKCPPALVEQLAEGGILIAPVGPHSEQVLKSFRKIDGQLKETPVTLCRFVPLIANTSEADAN